MSNSAFLKLESDDDVVNDILILVEYDAEVANM